MSRFTQLRKHLSFSEALKIYLKLKTKDYRNWSSSVLRYPFDLRNNEFDYYTYLEVILNRGYDVSFALTPKTIIDGGGNIGLTAAFFATKFPEASIVTLEPDKANFQLLQQNTAPYQNIRPVCAGLWPQTAHLVVNDYGQGANSLVVEETAAETPGAVPAYSITNVLAQMGWTSVDLLKLDVEGAEKEIFSHNYESWLPKTRVLMVEMHDRMKKGCSKAVFSTISQYNFSFEVAGENVVFTNEDSVQD